MKKIKSHLWKGALCLLAAAFIVTLLLSGHGLRLHEPEPLASQTASIRPEGQGAEPIEDSSEPEETEPTEPTEPSETEPPAETEPSEATEPTEPSSVSHPGETEPAEPSGSGGASGDDGGGGIPLKAPRMTASPPSSPIWQTARSLTTSSSRMCCIFMPIFSMRPARR